MKTIRDLLILIFFFAGIWYVFTQLTTTSEKLSLELSESQRRDLADWISETVEKEYDRVEIEALDSALDMIKERLVAEIDPDIGDLHIKVLRGEQVNAFATFGNQIYIFDGLIKLTESPEELAAIIGHEIGHIQLNHIERKLIKEVGISLATIVLSGGDPVLVAEVARTLISTSYDRKQERESDDFSLHVLDSAKLPTTAMVSVFMKINREKSSLPEELNFISTHPNLQERIESAASFKRKFRETELFTMDWESLKKNL